MRVYLTRATDRVACEGATAITLAIKDSDHVKRGETIPPVRFVLGCSAHLPCTPFQDGASSPTSSPRGSEAQCSSGHSPMPLAWPTGAKYYHQRWALAGGGGVLRYALVLKTLQE